MLMIAPIRENESSLQDFFASPRLNCGDSFTAFSLFEAVFLGFRVGIAALSVAMGSL